MNEVPPNFPSNFSCDDGYVPSAFENLQNLGNLGIGLLSGGTICTIFTLYLALDTCCNVFHQKESNFYRSNVIFILMLYPVASIGSLSSLAMPRVHLISETIIQVFLATCLYRLYLLLVHVARTKVTKVPQLMLKVGPCCCWPCLPFPTPQFDESNLFFVRLSVLQLPVVQSSLYCVHLFIVAEEKTLPPTARLPIQFFTFVSILFGVYGLSIVTKSLQVVAAEARALERTTVTQMVLLFSKLQAVIVRILGDASVFPCDPPVTPQIYASVTQSALMLIEMLLLCYAARRVYYVHGETQKDSTTGSSVPDEPKDKPELPVVHTNNNEVA